MENIFSSITEIEKEIISIWQDKSFMELIRERKTPREDKDLFDSVCELSILDY